MIKTEGLTESYKVLDKVRLDNGMYLASPSSDYSYIWLRDSFYEVMPYLKSSCGRYEETYHAILDMFKNYKWKLQLHTKQRPREIWEFIHARYDAKTFTEVDMPWGHAQHDAIGAVLFGIGQGEEVGKTIIRDDEDFEIIQLLVDYLKCCEYWHDEDNGMWEEYREVHSSSVGAVVGGLRKIKEQGLAEVPQWLINNGMDTLNSLFPYESKTKAIDLAQLSLIYPYEIFTGDQAEEIINRVVAVLERRNGVIRYLGDSYYAYKHGHELDRDKDPFYYYGAEAEWCFGFPWLAIAYYKINRRITARYYVEKTQWIMQPDGSLPELYLADTDIPNGNTPLGWANAMYILAYEMIKK